MLAIQQHAPLLLQRAELRSYSGLKGGGGHSPYMWTTPLVKYHSSCQLCGRGVETRQGGRILFYSRSPLSLSLSHSISASSLPSPSTLFFFFSFCKPKSISSFPLSLSLSLSLFLLTALLDRKSRISYSRAAVHSLHSVSGNKQARGGRLYPESAALMCDCQSVNMS
jgi:hypothetical protein